jgi:hypothetical protein
MRMNGMRSFAAAAGLLALAVGASTRPAAAVDATETTQACKAAIALVFGRDPKIMVIERVDDGIVYLHYTRADDSSTWRYRCKLDDDRVIWSANDGGPLDHWREDQHITYRIAGGQLEVRETFGDGAVAAKSFPLSAL